MQEVILTIVVVKLFYLGLSNILDNINNADNHYFTNYFTDHY
jgi:hypothetical protein